MRKFFRYAKDKNHLFKGNLSLILNLILFSLFSVLLTLGADIIINSNVTQAERFLTNPTDIIGKIDNTYLTVISLFFIVVASLSTNLVANYIPSQNTLLNFVAILVTTFEVFGNKNFKVFPSPCF